MVNVEVYEKESVYDESQSAEGSTTTPQVTDESVEQLLAGKKETLSPADPGAFTFPDTNSVLANDNQKKSKVSAPPHFSKPIRKNDILKCIARKEIALCRGERYALSLHSIQSPEYRKLQDVLSEHHQDLERLTDLKHTPASDRRKERRGKRFPDPDYRSFNKDFFREFYCQVPAQLLHLAYLEVIWTTADSRCHALHVKCCAERKHDSECEEKWRHLKRYLTITLFDELGVDAYPDSLLVRAQRSRHRG